jgi:hypothetical protein
MLNRRSRRAKRIRTPIENRETTFRTKNASGFVERCVTILDFMPDVGEYHEIAGRGREMCMRRTPHNKVDVVRSDRVGQAGTKLIDHPRPPLYGEHPADRADAATNWKCIKRFPGADLDDCHPRTNIELSKESSRRQPMLAVPDFLCGRTQ